MLWNVSSPCCMSQSKNWAACSPEYAGISFITKSLRHVVPVPYPWRFLLVFRVLFFFIGPAVLGNRWHPHVDIRFIHCQLIGLAYFLFCTGSWLLSAGFSLHISLTRFQVSSRMEIFVACWICSGSSAASPSGGCPPLKLVRERPDLEQLAS